MKKSFKKAIAVLLAVLMVAFSVPFTALAAVGDYEPNIDIMFGTFHNTNGDWFTYSATGKTTDYGFCGLYDAPLTYDAKAGTLTLEAAKANKANEILEYDDLDADYTYGVGDYFTATVTLDNVDILWAMQAYIKYSDNIEPAGMYSYKSGRTSADALGSVSEAKAVDGTFSLGGINPLENMSAVNFYNGLLNNLDGNDDSSFVNVDEQRMEVVVVNETGADTVDITSVGDDYFANPETGDLSEGYTYNGVAIMETFVFKIVAPGPITFEMADPDDTIGGFNAGYFCAKMSEGILLKDLTTYAPNHKDGENEEDPSITNAGSCKMTFFGKNVHVDEEEPEPEEHVHNYTSEYVDPTCEDDGYWIYTCESEDGLECDEPSYEKPDTGSALGHDYNGEAAVAGEGEHYYACLNECGTYGFEGVKNATEECTPTIDGEDIEATCAQQGYKAARVCEVCEQVLEAEETLPKTEEHKGNIVPDTDVNKEATCTSEGWEGATKCELCGETVAEGHKTDKIAHVEVPDTDKNTPATSCTDGGWVDATKCDVCDEPMNEGKAGEPLPHNFTGEVARYDADGHYRYCSYGCETVNSEPEEHTMADVPGTAKDPQVGEAGKKADQKCNDCDYTVDGEEIAPLPVPNATYNVTIVSKPLGSTKITYTQNGETKTATIEATEEYGAATQTFAVDHDTQITIEATPNEGAKFVGWMVNDSILNAEDSENDNPHTGTVLADITYEPIFQHVSDEDAKFTVIFTDKYGNIYSTQTVESGAEIEIPAGPVYVGYTFTGWSLSNEAIKALTSAATIYARYERNVEETFTVTANGATISTPYATTQNVNTGIGYNTEVTVTAEGATAWYINGAVVGYGDSYTFYVGADVTLTYVTTTVTETPVVAAVSVEKIGSTGAIKASFLASRKLVDGYTYVNAGFIYGANVEPTELTLASVDQDAIRAYYCTTSSEQFALNVGLAAQTGKLAATAFLAYVDNAGDGSTQVVYAPFTAFDYDA